MGFSKYLDSKRSEIKQLVAELKKTYQYVSVLGVDIKATDISVDINTSNIDPGSDLECGFVIKMSNGREFYEYSLD
ncbi:MAG: TldD/PmbA family protein, partial [Lachnospiraceae bacterium]|nr:TldD/PmbA family protein [Lachnospiraceae bacterium]